jgi:membrane associated rhomboid family serine protease
MFAVYMFGRVLESVWGPKRFLIYYMITGVGAGLIQELAWFFELHDVISSAQEMVNVNGVQLLSKKDFLDLFVTVGASGSVFGILLAFGMKFPNVPLYLMFIPIPIKAKYFVAGYGLSELFLGVASFNGDSVAHFAHLGGMLFGYLLLYYWKKKDGEYFY